VSATVFAAFAAPVPTLFAGALPDGLTLELRWCAAAKAREKRIAAARGELFFCKCHRMTCRQLYGSFRRSNALNRMSVR
jgi:hypothetical protein